MNFFRKNKKKFLVAVAVLTLATGFAQEKANAPKGGASETGRFWGLGVTSLGNGVYSICSYAFWVSYDCTYYYQP